MSNRVLEDWLDGFLEWTKESESPTMYKLWTGISVVAAALQRKCCLQWGGLLTFYPNMYVILVGPSGARKGTAMSPGYRLLSDLKIKMSAQSTTRQALIRSLKEANHTTVEELTQAPMFHSSLTIFSEEFTVFLGYQNHELMADLCDWFDCKEVWTYDTKNMGRDDITGVWVNLIGATTPALIRSSLPSDSFGGGLTSRMIFVYAEGREKINPLPKADSVLYDKLRRDLEHIHMMNGKFNVTEEFYKKYVTWYMKEGDKKIFNDERFDGYEMRRPTHLLKLSMIMAASRRDGGNLIIKDGDFERALTILSRTERKMPYAFSGVGQSNIADLIQRVVVYLAKERTVLKAHLMQRFYSDADAFTMKRVLETLEQMEYIRYIFSGTAPEKIEFIYKGDPK